MNKETFFEKVTATVAVRDATYAAPQRAHTMIADYWSLHIRNRFGTTLMLTPQDVQMMMVQLKLVRLTDDPGLLDSMIDIAGYAACMADRDTQKELELPEPTQAFEGTTETGKEN